MSSTITLTGVSGRAYDFVLCDPAAPWNPLPGTFVFARDNHRPLYVGETANLAARRPGDGDAMWRQAQALGATQVLARVNQEGEAARRAEEADLIRAYDPRCNAQPRLSMADIAAARMARPRLRVVEGGAGA